MKRILAILLSLATLLSASALVSCGTVKTEETSGQTTAPVNTEATTELPETTTELPETTKTQVPETTAPPETGSSPEYIRKPLETFFLSTNNVIKATCTGIEDGGTYNICEFSVKEKLRSVIKEESIILNVYKKSSWATYTVGGDYLLLIRGSAYALNESVKCSLVTSYLTIVLDGEGKADLSGSYIYGEPLEKHISSQETFDAFEESRFEAYLLDKIKDNPSVSKPYDFTDSTDIAQIANFATDVFEVYIESSSNPHNAKDREQFVCKIENVLKGEYDKEKIEIALRKDKASVGKKYILCLVCNDGFYTLAAFEGVIDISCKDTVTKALSK